MRELTYNPIEVAIGTVITIIIAFAIIKYSKPKKPKVGGVYWTATAYFEHLKKNILISDSIEGLSALKASIEGFRVKSFRDKMFRWDRRRYYRQLKEAYESKERNLILHPKAQQLCKS